MDLSRVRVTALLFLLGLFLIFVVPGAALGQGGPRGAIAGMVKDPSGALIPGAQVEIISQETGLTERTVMTGDDGHFRASLLPVGIYKVVVTLTGFAKAEAPDIKVNVAETTDVVINLKVGEITETVTVEGAAVAVQVSAPTTGRIIGPETVSQLPLSTRNFFALLTLSAGANSEMFDSAALGRGQVTVTVNGQRAANNNYQLEGINANDFNLPVLDNVPLPNPSTIQEFKTQTALYDASTGRNAGGNIQVTLKSGTEKYHGELFEFFRNDVLNANDFFNNRDEVERPVLRQNAYGASFGGPVPFMEKFFFFGNWQGTRAASGASAGTFFSTTMPVLPSDRSEASLIRTFFPNGLPPGVTRLDPVAVGFLNLAESKCPGLGGGGFCIPATAGTPGVTETGVNLGRVTRAGLGTFGADQFTITMDKQLGVNDKITGRWFFSQAEAATPFGGTRSTLRLPRLLPTSNRFLKLGWTRVISPTTINDFRFGFNRFVFAQTPGEPISLGDVGATRGNQSVIPAAFRIAITGGGAFSFGTDVNDDRGGAFNTFEWADDFSLTLGKHLIRFGGEASRYQLNRFNRFATRGSVTMRDTAAGAGGENFPALFGFQNFLLGRISGTQGGAGFFNVYFRATDFAAYIQDDWKLHPRFTLNLGLRWEGLAFSHDRQNHLSNFRGLYDGDPGPIRIIHPERTAKVGTPGVSSCTLLECFDKNNFAPRFGFAWDVFGNQRTALRGGYGIYYVRTSNQPVLQTFGGLPFNEPSSASPFSVTLRNPFPSSRPDSDFPLDQDQVVPRLIGFNGTTGAPIFETVPGITPGTPLSGFFFYPARNFDAPYGQHWTLTIQQEVIKDWVLEVGYVGTRGVGLIGPGRPLNPAQVCTNDKPCVIPASIGSGVSVPAGTPGVRKNADGSIAITESTVANRNARVQPLFMGLANLRGFFQEQAGQSAYHGLQATLSHQFASGLYFQGAYTWSKSIDNGSGSAFVDELNGLLHYGNLEDPKDNFGVSDFDRTHRLTASYNYELPFARWAGMENRGFWGRLFHGWAITGVTTFQSGTPFTIDDTGALIINDPEGQNGVNRATLAPGKTLRDAGNRGDVNKRIDEFIDLSAFIAGGLCVNSQNRIVGSISSTDEACDSGLAAVGNVGRNSFRGPFQQNWDLSLVKTTKVSETASVEFRAEFFNIWNHPAFQSPQAQGDNFGNFGIVDVSSDDSSIFSTVNRPRIIQFALKIHF
ncbi:MAG: TonB-dependent receptor [Acidobacteria bacterium]|nr:TonB-dependent receptor [Acidobacteriota bacterium]